MIIICLTAEQRDPLSFFRFVVVVVDGAPANQLSRVLPMYAMFQCPPIMIHTHRHIQQAHGVKVA